MTPAAQTSQPADETAQQLHIDDLLVREPTRQSARERYPTLAHVIDDEALRSVFLPIDQTANRAKRRSHNAGSAAILLAVIALCATAVVLEAPPQALAHLIAIGAAGLGALAALVAATGILYGARKELWLEQRLFTERLRQLHFQSFIWRLPEIAASCDPADPDARTRFEQARAQRLEAFAKTMKGQAGSQLAAILSPAAPAAVWLHDGAGDEPPGLPKGLDTQALFNAYRELRIDVQIEFANQRLAKGPWRADFNSLSIRRKLELLGGVWIVAVAVLAVLLAMVLLGAFGLVRVPFWSVIVTAILWSAFIALGARILQESLGLRSDISRYEKFRANIQDLRARFEAADDANKLKLMMEMERTVFQEMRAFLRSHDEASFVM